MLSGKGEYSDYSGSSHTHSSGEGSKGGFAKEHSSGSASVMSIDIELPRFSVDEDDGWEDSTMKESIKKDVADTWAPPTAAVDDDDDELTSNRPSGVPSSGRTSQVISGRASRGTVGRPSVRPSQRLSLGSSGSDAASQIPSAASKPVLMRQLSPPSPKAVLVSPPSAESTDSSASSSNNTLPSKSSVSSLDIVVPMADPTFNPSGPHFSSTDSADELPPVKQASDGAGSDSFGDNAPAWSLSSHGSDGPGQELAPSGLGSFDILKERLRQQQQEQEQQQQQQNLLKEQNQQNNNIINTSTIANSPKNNALSISSSQQLQQNQTSNQQQKEDQVPSQTQQAQPKETDGDDVDFTKLLLSAPAHLKAAQSPVDQQAAASARSSQTLLSPKTSPRGRSPTARPPSDDVSPGISLKIPKAHQKQQKKLEFASDSSSPERSDSEADDQHSAHVRRSILRNSQSTNAAATGSTQPNLAHPASSTPSTSRVRRGQSRSSLAKPGATLGINTVTQSLSSTQNLRGLPSLSGGRGLQDSFYATLNAAPSHSIHRVAASEASWSSLSAMGGDKEKGARFARLFQRFDHKKQGVLGFHEVYSIFDAVREKDKIPEKVQTKFYFKNQIIKLF